MNIAVAQSGGPTCAINASLLGVIKEALKVPSIGTIYGSVNGIEGIINDHLVDLKTAIRTNEDMELLRQTPSTVLGSCRFKLPDESENAEVYKAITDCLDRRDIKAFFYIGGNDSMDTVNKLSKYFKKINKDIKVIGVPKTIDNDLCETDHTPGFGSAAKYVATSVQEIARDSSVYSIKSVTIIEVMGRHAGWLAASASVLHANGEDAPHLIYLPECEFNIERFLYDVGEKLKQYKAVIVVVSEGITLTKPEETQVHQTDGFGHLALSGIGKQLEKIVAENFSIKVRSIELNVMQRCASHISSRTDINEAEKIGSAAVTAALNGETGKMMAFRRILDMPYTVAIEPVDAEKVANNERFFPNEWINCDRNNVTDKALPYFLPLIQGEQIIKMQNGLPVHYKVGNILD
ncbi:MAG: 6-phosphofructokinase [Clostridia bacterium]|nr:6-phosphofructokinase [Clostridia bacterium]